MADSLNGSVSVSVAATLTGDVGIGTDTHEVNKTYKTSFTDGTGADQANQLFSDTRTISASGTDDLDLAGGLTNALGTTLTFTSIKGIIIKADGDNTNNVEVGGDASAPIAELFGSTSDKIILPPGSTFAIVNPEADGYAVSEGSTDILQIANSAGGSTVDYDIIIIGEV